MLDRTREAALLKSREQMLSDRQLKRDIDRVYELLMSISRAHQQKLMKAEKSQRVRRRPSRLLMRAFRGIRRYGALRILR